MPDPTPLEAIWKLTRVLREAGWVLKSSTDPVESRPLPDWVKVGQWVHCVPSGRTAIIEDVIEHGTIGWVAVRMRYWRETRDDVIEPYTFHTHWRPCAPPKEPRTTWERLLEEASF